MKKSFNFKYEFGGKGEISNFKVKDIPAYMKAEIDNLEDPNEIASLIESEIQMGLDNAEIYLPLPDLDCTVSVYPVQDDDEA